MKRYTGSNRVSRNATAPTLAISKSIRCSIHSTAIRVSKSLFKKSLRRKHNSVADVSTRYCPCFVHFRDRADACFLQCVDVDPRTGPGAFLLVVGGVDVERRSRCHRQLARSLGTSKPETLVAS